MKKHENINRLRGFGAEEDDDTHTVEVTIPKAMLDAIENGDYEAAATLTMGLWNVLNITMEASLATNQTMLMDLLEAVFKHDYPLDTEEQTQERMIDCMEDITDVLQFHGICAADEDIAP